MGDWQYRLPIGSSQATAVGGHWSYEVTAEKENTFFAGTASCIFYVHSEDKLVIGCEVCLVYFQIAIAEAGIA